MNEPDDDLHRFADRLFLIAEHAEAHAEHINRLVSRLAGTGVLADDVILGPVIQLRDYHVTERRTDSAQVAQAVLHLRDGLGIALFDLEEHLLLEKDVDELRITAKTRFIPFAECDIVTKALLLPHIRAFVEQLRKRLQ
jgi:hypothetical protein